jgi:DNA-binding transcriptional ArsR family regulator/predicted GIY-YIG superfamily endonuclease
MTTSYAPNGAGYVYVVQFDDLAIKVGRSSDPTGRIDRHRVESAKYGRTVIAFWSSDKCDDLRTELELKRYCADHGVLRPGTREYYTELVFAQCAAAGERLAGTDWTEHDTRHERELASLRSQVQRLRIRLTEAERNAAAKAERRRAWAARAEPISRCESKPPSEPADVLAVMSIAARTVPEIMAATGLSRATVYRHLAVLADQEAIQASERGRWRLVS